MIWALLLHLNCLCQDSIIKRKQWDFSGYIKELVWLTIDKSFQNAYVTNLVHNRINLKWNPSQKISGRLELRNRFYWGDDVKMLPNFNEQLRNRNEFIDASTTWWHRSTTISHSNIERLWLEYRSSKWKIRAGRQRINWGISNTWNPNDLFNTFNFLNFDYTEKPGNDAVKFQYSVSELSNIEIASARTSYHSISAIKYFTNYRKYDLQAIAGIYQNTFTAGMGWAGSVSDLGFKGEAQFYTHRKDSVSNVIATTEVDYIFKSGWYLSSAILYNEKGLHAPLGQEMIVVFEVSPRNLMPARWSILLTSSKDFTPRFNGSMDVVYSPRVNMLILFPSLRYNLKPNLDLDFVWQSFFAERKTFQALTHSAFLRLKWSFAT